jgi:tripartite-type tricarboxylate transporter receptor subunit TctC
VAQKLNEAGYVTMVENRPGANGSVAAEALVKSPPDGYTIMVGSIGTFAINMGLYKNPRYDVMRDLDAITVAVSTPNVLITPPQFPANTLKEFIDYARKNPGKVSYGSSGSGSSDHLSAEMFKIQTQSFGVHIPYRGGAAAQTDIMAGNIEASFQNFGTVVPYIRAGKMKALAVTSKNRMPQLPQVPTMAELGFPQLEFRYWAGLFAPAQTPMAAVKRLESEVHRILKMPEVAAQMATSQVTATPATSEELAKLLAADLARWGAVAESAKIKSND